MLSPGMEKSKDDPLMTNVFLDMGCLIWTDCRKGGKNIEKEGSELENRADQS